MEISNFEVDPTCTNNESVLSTITKIKTKYLVIKESEKYTVDLIIKRLPKDPFSRFFVTEGQFDLREIKFYTQVSETRDEIPSYLKSDEFLIALIYMYRCVR